MEESLIVFETADLAEKANYPFKYTTIADEKVPFNIPTQSLIQKWLREKYDIWVEIQKDYNYAYIDYAIKKVNKKGRYYTAKRSNYSDNNSIKTYEEALEKGLQEALKLI